MTMAVTLRAGPGAYSERFGEDAWRDRLALRLGGVRRERRSLESEERDRLRLAVLHDRDFALAEIGDRLALLIGRDNRELHQRRSGAEDRRGLAGWRASLAPASCAAPISTAAASRNAAAASFFISLTVEYRLQRCNFLFQHGTHVLLVQDCAAAKTAQTKGYADVLLWYRCCPG